MSISVKRYKRRKRRFCYAWSDSFQLSAINAIKLTSLTRVGVSKLSNLSKLFLSEFVRKRRHFSDIVSLLFRCFIGVYRLCCDVGIKRQSDRQTADVPNVSNLPRTDTSEPLRIFRAVNFAASGWQSAKTTKPGTLAPGSITNLQIPSRLANF